MDRQLAWTDPTVVKLLEEFVPCTDEVWNLYYGKTPEADLFRSFCDEDHYSDRRGKGTTRQGMYIVTPSGKLLRSWNNRDPKRVAKMLSEGLEKWKKLTPEERTPKAPLIGKGQTQRAEDSYPEDGLVLRVFTRDLPRDDEPEGESEDEASDWRAGAWNIDHLWLTKDEAKALAAGKLPRDSVNRLFRTHARDNARGQSRAFPAEAVKFGMLISQVVGEKDGVKELELAGSTVVSETGKWQINDRFDEKAEHTREFTGAVYGKAKWDGERFTEFKMVMSGIRAGATQFNERADDLGPAPMGVVFELAPANDRVAPSMYWTYRWKAPQAPQASGESK